MNSQVNTMTLKRVNDFEKNGYVVINLPKPSKEITDSFNNMPRDSHSLGRCRHIRLSQYFIYWEDNSWVLALLPQRKYVQSAKFIRLAEAGGVKRHREQLQVDVTSVVSPIMDALGLERSGQYQANVNQIRVVCNEEFKGITVPEGPHRDGHQYSVIAVVKRENVDGGVTQVIDPDTIETLFETTLEENQAILLDDENFIHYASEITPTSGNTCYRDIWVVEINEWSNRCYGPTHDREASLYKIME